MAPTRGHAQFALHYNTWQVQAVWLRVEDLGNPFNAYNTAPDCVVSNHVLLNNHAIESHGTVVKCKVSVSVSQ